MVEPVCMKIGASIVRTCIGSLKKPHIASLKMIFQKIMGDRSCTYSTNRTHFLPIRQTFVLFTRDGRKGLRCPGWEIVHVRWSSILGKWDGSILKRHFGGYFTKRPVFVLRKWKKAFPCDKKENFLLQHCSPYQCPHACIIWAQHHKLCRDSAHNIGHLD